MGQHEGRRASTAPGPGAGTNPAAGIAPVPAQATAEVTAEAGAPAAVAGPASLHASVPTAHVVLALVNKVCDLYAQAEVARAMAGNSASAEEYAYLSAHAARWQTLVNERWAALATAIETALPEAARVERFMPVRPLTNGHVELHADDTNGRRVVVLFTGTQALAVGTHLTAYGAISLDRIGHKLDSDLPLVKQAPPFASTTPAADRPPGRTGSPAARP